MPDTAEAEQEAAATTSKNSGSSRHREDVTVDMMGLRRKKGIGVSYAKIFSSHVNYYTVGGNYQ